MRITVPLLTLPLLLAACAAPRATGADRDRQGCIASAGYHWCERTRQCERPWELARERGFANTGEGFAAYCAMPAPQ